MSREVTVSWTRLDDHDPARFESLLSADERDRAASFRFGRDRGRYVVARGLLRTLLGERLGIEPRRVAFAYGERGKPRLAGAGSRLRFNLAHSEDVIAVALCEGPEVGIDVEAHRHDLDAKGIARRYLPPEAAAEIERRPDDERPAEFIRAWVRQEAYAKGRGAGLELMGEIPEGWSIADLELLEGYAAAVAVDGAPPDRISATPIASRLLRAARRRSGVSHAPAPRARPDRRCRPRPVVETTPGIVGSRSAPSQ